MFRVREPDTMARNVLGAGQRTPNDILVDHMVDDERHLGLTVCDGEHGRHMSLSNEGGRW